MTRHTNHGTLMEHRQFLTKMEIALISDKGFTMEFCGDCNKNCILLLWSEWHGHIDLFQVFNLEKGYKWQKQKYA